MAGYSDGDREMLEYATAGNGARFGMLVLHDDKVREYALRSGGQSARHEGGDLPAVPPG
jgi:hypothetical protein